MKIAVMGAGAVGCYYGFKLARAGCDVVLIGRPQHVEAVERQGLRLETQNFDEHVRVSASTEGSAVRGAQHAPVISSEKATRSGPAAGKPRSATNWMAESLGYQVSETSAERSRGLAARSA